jgi:hypothetical protein|tara:strand:- start:131 stop:310 length:180 start_codon:yes stop_codon:yes gene_type:complete
MKKFLVGLISIIILFSTNLHAIEKKQIVDDAGWGKKIDTPGFYHFKILCLFVYFFLRIS